MELRAIVRADLIPKTPRHPHLCHSGTFLRTHQPFLQATQSACRLSYVMGNHADSWSAHTKGRTTNWLLQEKTRNKKAFRSKLQERTRKQTMYILNRTRYKPSIPIMSHPRWHLFLIRKMAGVMAPQSWFSISPPAENTCSAAVDVAWTFSRRLAAAANRGKYVALDHHQLCGLPLRAKGY